MITKWRIAIATSAVSITHIKVLAFMVKRYTFTVRTCARYHCWISRCVFVITHKNDRLYFHASIATTPYSWIVAELSITCLPYIAFITLHQICFHKVFHNIILTQRSLNKIQKHHAIQQCRKHRFTVPRLQQLQIVVIVLKIYWYLSPMVLLLVSPNWADLTFGS